MLLFTLLTSLFLHTQAASAKDTLQSHLSRPTVGFFYMTGPRGLQSQGFAGGCLAIPFGGGAYKLGIFVGGYSKYTESGYRTNTNTSHLSGIEVIPVTYTDPYGGTLGIDLMRSVYSIHPVWVSIGLQAGVSQLWRKENFATLPEQNRPTGSPDDTINVYTFDRFASRYTSRSFWLAPKIEIGYKPFERCSIVLSYTCGPRAFTERRHIGGNSYVIKGAYSPYVNGNYEPYNQALAPIRVAGTYGDYNYASRPTLNRFDLFGTSILMVGMQYQL